MSNFHASAEHIRVDDGHMLRAVLHNGSGEAVEAELDLNSVIGNDNGNFCWGGEDFSHSSENISFSLEGADSVPILRASLRDTEGNLQDRDLNLSERIGNSDGAFSFE